MTRQRTQTGRTRTTRSALQTRHWQQGEALAQVELPALEQRLTAALATDVAVADALAPVRRMRERGELTLCGYAALLWERLEAREPYEVYYSAAGHPCLWDGVQRIELPQWNVMAADMWATWATMDDEADDEADDEGDHVIPQAGGEGDE